MVSLYDVEAMFEGKKLGWAQTMGSVENVWICLLGSQRAVDGGWMIG